MIPLLALLEFSVRYSAGHKVCASPCWICSFLLLPPSRRGTGLGVGVMLGQATFQWVSVGRHTTGPYYGTILRTILRDHITGPYYGTILRDHITGPYYGTILRDHITGPDILRDHINRLYRVLVLGEPSVAGFAKLHWVPRHRAPRLLKECIRARKDAAPCVC